MPWTEEQSDEFRADDKQIMDSGIPRLNFEEKQTKADGNEIIVLVSKVPMYDESGGINGILGIYTDITERKKARRRIKSSPPASKRCQ